MKTIRTATRLWALLLTLLTLLSLFTACRKPSPADSGDASSQPSEQQNFDAERSIAVTEDITYRFRFVNETLQILDAAGNTVQMIPFLAGNYVYCRDELSCPDLNGDGAADLFFPLLKEEGEDGTTVYNECYLFDSESKLFLPLDGAADLPNLTFEDGMLASVVKTAVGCSYRTTYRIEGFRVSLKGESLPDAGEVAFAWAKKILRSELGDAAVNGGSPEQTDACGLLQLYKVYSNEGHRFLIAVGFTMDGSRGYYTTDFRNYFELQAA